MRNASIKLKVTEAFESCCPEEPAAHARMTLETENRTIRSARSCEGLDSKGVPAMKPRALIEDNGNALKVPAGPTKSRHHSLTNLEDFTFGAKQLLAARLAPAYHSARSLIVRRFSGKTASVAGDPEAPASEATAEIDAGESPPVDDSLFFDNLVSLRDVKISNRSVKSAICAAVSLQEMRLLLDLERGKFPVDSDGRLFPDADNRLKSIAYIWACFRGLVHLLQRLEESGAQFDYVDASTGVNALLAASLSGKIACLQRVIERGADVNFVNPINGYTALHFAAFGDSHEAVDVLLDNGATLETEPTDEEVDPVLHCAVRAKSTKVVKLLLERGASVSKKNHLGETPLHVACIVQATACAELLLQSPGVDVNAVDRVHRTPLHFAVMNTESNVGLVELLLRCSATVNAADRQGFTPLHIAALNEQSRCVDTLIWAGADVSATTSSGLSALNVILRKIPESLQVFRQKLDASIRLRRPVPHNREFEVRFHFELLFPSGNECETSFVNTFVQEGRKDLLSHPLVMAFLYLKWEKIRKLYLIRILLYAMTVICMTTYVLTALAYKCYNQQQLQGEPTSKFCGNRRFPGFFFRRPVIEIEWYLLVVLTCTTIPRKIFGFMIYKSARQYFMNIDNILDMIVIVSVFVISFVYTGRTYDWQNYVGAFSILCAWTNLMLMVGQLPAFGTYVAMFTHIQFEFAKLLLAYSGLLIGFTISFCVIFAGEPSFGNPFTGLIKVLAMMAGELDFEGLINPEEGDAAGQSMLLQDPLSVCSQILFTLFIVFVTVILMNLLVGIAVHDIQGLRNHAGLTKLVRQTKLILFTEMMLHHGIVPFRLRKCLLESKIDIEDRKRVLVVKPLNPLEKRLPKDILKAAYEIAQKNVPMMSEENFTFDEHLTWMKHQDDEEEDRDHLRSAVETLSTRMRGHEDSINTIKEHLLDTNRMLRELVTRLGKEGEIRS